MQSFVISDYLNVNVEMIRLEVFKGAFAVICMTLGDTKTQTHTW